MSTQSRKNGLAVSVLALLLGLLPVGAATPPIDDDPEKADATEESAAPSSRPWNTFDKKQMSGYFFGGIALDSVRHWQESGSQGLLGDLGGFETPEIRVVRLGLAGNLKFSKPWFYHVSLAYLGFGRGFDRETEPSWTLFDLRLEIPVGKAGRLTVGKFKEPFSTERLMGGGVLPGMERAMGTEALTPARNAGVQLSNSSANKRMTWAAGVFNDFAFSHESFSDGSNQVIGRVTGLAMDEPDGRGLLHFGLAARYSDVETGLLAFNTKPEVNPFPLVLETGNFAAESMTYGLIEAYYQKGRLWLGSELITASIESTANSDPTFQSAWVQASWILNGKSRPYIHDRGFFGVLRPERNVTDRGPGLFEIGARFSTVDLEDRGVSGGEGSRLTGMVNWYLTNKALLAFNYGLIDLDVGGASSTSQTFQMRLFLLF